MIILQTNKDNENKLSLSSSVMVKDWIISCVINMEKDNIGSRHPKDHGIHHLRHMANNKRKR